MEEKKVYDAAFSATQKKTVRTDEDKKSLLNRLSRIEGQIRGVRRMVENDAYCPDIMIQAAAARAAIKSFNKALLENHMQLYVAQEIRAGNDEVMAELVHALHKLV